MAPRLHFRQLLAINNIAALTHGWHKKSSHIKGGSKERVQGCAHITSPRDEICSFLIITVQSLHSWYVFSAVQIMLLPCQKPSSSYSLLKYVYVTSQLRHPLVVHPLLRKNPGSAPAYAWYNDAHVYAPIASCLVCSSNETLKQHFHMVAVLLVF